MAVVRTGVGEQNEQVLVRGSRFHQLAHAAQSQTVAVPARGKVVEHAMLAVFVPEILQNAQHRVAAQAAEAGHAHGNAAGDKAFGEKIALNGDALLTVQARGRGVEHQVDGEARAALLILAEKDAAVVQHRCAPDARTVQPPLAGEDVLGLLMDEHTVADLLRQAQESILMQCTVADVGGAVALGLLGSLLEKTLRVGAHGLARHALAAGEPEMAAEVIAGAAALLDARERLRGIEAAAEAALDVVVILRFALVRAKLGAQRVGRAHHAVLAGDRGAADGQLVGADDLDRQELGEQRRPAVAEMKAER